MSSLMLQTEFTDKYGIDLTFVSEAIRTHSIPVKGTKEGKRRVLNLYDEYDLLDSVQKLYEDRKISPQKTIDRCDEKIRQIEKWKSQLKGGDEK